MARFKFKSDPKMVGGDKHSLQYWWNKCKKSGLVQLFALIAGIFSFMFLLDLLDKVLWLEIIVFTAIGLFLIYKIWYHHTKYNDLFEKTKDLSFRGLQAEDTIEEKECKYHNTKFYTYFTLTLHCYSYFYW